MTDLSTIFESTLTGPVCGHVKTERLTPDACQWFYECEACRTMFTPKAGDCCLFCSFGSVPCLPKQAGGAHRYGRGYRHSCYRPQLYSTRSFP